MARPLSALATGAFLVGGIAVAWLWFGPEAAPSGEEDPAGDSAADDAPADVSGADAARSSDAETPPARPGAVEDRAVDGAAVADVAVTLDRVASELDAVTAALDEGRMDDREAWAAIGTIYEAGLTDLMQHMDEAAARRRLAKVGLGTLQEDGPTWGEPADEVLRDVAAGRR